MERKSKEFQELKQGKSSVSEYLSQFTQLARYGKADVATEADRTSRFLNGLNSLLKDRLVAHDFPTFQHLVDKALKQENSRKELEEQCKRKAPSHHGAGGSRPKYQQRQFQKGPNPRFPRPNAPVPSNSYQTPKANVGGFHANTAGRACFRCGQEGHFANACPNRDNTGPTPVKFNLGSAAKTPQPGQGRGVPQTPASAPRAPGQFGRGRVNNVIAEQAQEAPDIVLGKFLVNSELGTVLFDSGASHSFVTKAFAEKHRLPIGTSKVYLIVQSPGGELRTNA